MITLHKHAKRLSALKDSNPFSFTQSKHFVKFVYSKLKHEPSWNRGVYIEHTLTSKTQLFFSPWSALEVAEFYVPPVPVFVLPGSVFDGVPPSDRCAKQRRSALALQTTPGALTKPRLPPLSPLFPNLQHQHGPR